ncbi:IQ motif, EF-hand binding site [Parasponia andersonii]|uniref:IQ motif, EF-hand binding site n=1 Tax=Parasponia andersonii TaxID=3476 RepID=A0A2P5DM46_PARAD|nr:IQ motif, EF-hand binding site [Parasponia andersonii]
MAKKKSWFSLVKRFFLSDSQSKQEKKEKRRKWIFGRLKIKRLASLTAPAPALPPSPPPAAPQVVDSTSSETEEKQSNHALSVAIASAAAAEVVRLNATYPRVVEGTEKASSIEHSAEHMAEKEIQESAAVKIQTAFRGYLARKALRALKGIVTLQAIIRGRAVRRQAVATLKRLQSIINIQSQVCANRFQTTEGTYHCDTINRNDQLLNLRDKILRMDSYNARRWDDSLMSKEDADALFLSKKEALIKRERIKEYWHTHRKSAETERNKVNGRWRYWLEQWVDTQLTKSKELEDLDTVLGSNTRSKDEFGVKKLGLRNLPNRNHNEGFMDSPVFNPRKSFHRKQCSLGDENSFISSPVVPTYMAATESARAKARSLSSPKLRPESLDGYSPCKNKLSLVSSITSEAPISSTVGKPGDYLHQRSPSMKGIRGPVKSNRKMNDLSFDSECSLSHWHQTR